MPLLDDSGRTIRITVQIETEIPEIYEGHHTLRAPAPAEMPTVYYALRSASSYPCEPVRLPFPEIS